MAKPIIDGTTPNPTDGFRERSTHPAVRTSMSGGLRSTGAPHIYAGKEEQPHDVDEMPVPSGKFKPQMLLGRELTGEGANEANNQKNRPNDDMSAVESSRHEESGAVDVARVVGRRMHVFIGLNAGETETKRDRKNESPFEAVTIVVKERVVRPRYGSARSQQDQCIEQRQVPGIEGLDSRRRPHVADEIGAHHLVNIGGKQRG